jgi:hypothetical protein
MSTTVEIDTGPHSRLPDFLKPALTLFGNPDKAQAGEAVQR